MSFPILSDLARPIAHIVHIGAGMGRDLPAYLEVEPGIVTLIEADPDAIAQLESVARNHPEVTVIEAAVSANSRKRAFRRTNFPELNSFRKPTGLKELFPGLRTLSEEVVKPVDPARLVGDLDMSGDGSNLLVIEAPGEALGILKALESADLLLGFDAIRLQEGCEVLYHQTPTAKDICSFLAGAGYSAGFETASEDSDRPYLVAHVDRAALDAARRIDNLTVALAQAQTTNDQLDAQSEAASQKAEELHARLTERDMQLESLQGERDAASQKVEEMRTRLTERDTRIESLKGEHNAATQKAEELRHRLTERDTQLKSLQGERNAATQKAEEMRARLAVMEQEVEAMCDELVEAQQNLSVSLRMQMLHNSDLKNLQQRYASLLQSKDAQDELLERLTVSLSNAALYLQKIDDSTDGKAPAKAIRRKKTPARKAKSAIASK